MSWLLHPGNASGIDRTTNLLVIKPSGIPYRDLRIDLMTVEPRGRGRRRCDTTVDGPVDSYRALQDLRDHRRNHAYSYSRWATIWAQMGRHIPCYGTTHADFFFGDIPCTERLPKRSTLDYERKTGEWIARHFASAELDYMKVPGASGSGSRSFHMGGGRVRGRSSLDGSGANRHGILDGAWRRAKSARRLLHHEALREKARKERILWTRQFKLEPLRSSTGF